jgi:hypothetical protein
VPPVVAELRGLAQQAKAGDATALPRIRAILDKHDEVWQAAGDLERVVTRAWTELLGDDPLGAEAVKRRAEQLRQQLEGDGPTPLESLLVGQVVCCWLEVAHAQFKMADPGRTPMKEAAFYLKQAESVQRRYLAAIKTLTTLRALVPQGLLPAGSRLRVHEPELQKKRCDAGQWPVPAPCSPAGNATPCGSSCRRSGRVRKKRLGDPLPGPDGGPAPAKPG